LGVNKAIRADDVSGLNIATVQNTDTDAAVKDFQRVVLNDGSTAGNMASVDGSGNLKVSATGTVTANAGSGTLAVRPSDGTNPVTKTFDLDTGAGTEYNLGVGLRKAASGGSVEAGTSSDPLRVDPTGTTSQPVTGTVTANLGTIAGVATAAKQPALGTAGTPSSDVITVQGKASMTPLLIDGSGVVQPVSGTFWQTTQPISAAALPLPTGAATAAKQPALGTAGTQSADVLTVQGDPSGTPIPVSGTFSASFGTATPGGYTIKHAVSAATTNATSVKASAGQVYGWSVYNNAAYPVYLKLHNTAGTPTAGSGVVLTIGIQAGTRDSIFNTHGISFGTGIGFTIVKDIADSGTTAVAASDCVVDLFYA
jgi:hypothetical protein